VIYDCSAFSDHEIKRSKIMLFHVPSSSRKVVPYLGCVSSEIIFKIIFCIYLLLEKLINEKYFSVKEKFDLIFRKVFFFYFRRKTLSESSEKFRNVILFTDYIKFGPQTFNYYIYIYIYYF
jgi:hypothetical protein